MQILDFLGSTANSSGVTAISDSKTHEAFSKHLDDVMTHRQEIRSEDAMRAAEASERPERRERLDDGRRTDDAGDEVDAEDNVKRPEAKDTSDNAKQDSSKAVDAEDGAKPVASTLGQANVDLAAATKGMANKAAEIAGGEAGGNQAGGTTANDIKILKDGAEGLKAAAKPVDEKAATIQSNLETDSAKINPAATKANANAAFADNQKAKAADAVNVHAGPFVADGDETVVAAAVIQETKAATPETSNNPKAEIDPSELPETASLAATAGAAQTKQKNSDAQNNNAKADNQLDADNADDVIADAPVEAGTANADARLQAMHLAAAHQEEANAEKIYQRFVAGVGGAAPAQAQAASAQASAQLQSAGVQPRAQMGEDGNQPRPDSTPISATPPAANAAAKSSVLPAQPSGQAFDHQGNFQPPMSDRAATALAQMSTAQKSSGGPAAMPQSAAQGLETAATSGNASPTPAAAPAESAQPLTQTAAAKPTAPAPTPQQPPQVQVAMQIAKAVQNGKDRISIRLNPADLGRVDVKLEISKSGQVSASITVERPETLELLKGDARALQRALADAGLEADSKEFNFNLRDQNSNQNLLAHNDDQTLQRPAGSENEDAETEDEIDLDAILAEARADAASDRALDINV